MPPVPISEKRVADLQPGDLTIHAGGSCVCDNPCSPFRVEKLDSWHDGATIAVTWSHPPCGDIAPPLPCSPDCLVTFFGRSER